jgi:3-methyladenine DNA glycosylase Mpg
MDWEPGLAWTTYIMRGRPTLNITTITPSCILIRAVEPIEGFILSRERTTVGPVNLAKAMKIDESLDKLDVCTYGPLFVCDFKLTSPIIVESKRKNVRIDTEECRHFFIKGNKFVS